MTEKYSPEEARAFFDDLSARLLESLSDKSSITGFVQTHVELIHKSEGRKPEAEGIFTKRYLAEPLDRYVKKFDSGAQLRIEGVTGKKKPLQFFKIFNQSTCPDFIILSDKIRLCGEVKYAEGTSNLMNAIGETIFRMDASQFQTKDQDIVFDYGFIIYFEKNQKELFPNRFDKNSPERRLIDTLWRKYRVYTMII